jgi:hypothetical protein
VSFLFWDRATADYACRARTPGRREPAKPPPVDLSSPPQRNQTLLASARALNHAAGSALVIPGIENGANRDQYQTLDYAAFCIRPTELKYWINGIT